MFYCVGQEIWLEDTGKLIYTNQSRFYNFFHAGKFENLKHISKYFSIFSNKPPASLVSRCTLLTKVKVISLYMRRIAVERKCSSVKVSLLKNKLVNIAFLED